MGNQSTTIFRAAGERTDLTLSKRAELLGMDKGYLSHIERENKQCNPHLAAHIAEVYNDYELVEDYCSHYCPVGQKFKVKPCKKGMGSTVISLNVSLGKAYQLMPRLMEILEDGVVDEAELPEFEKITLHITVVEKAVGQFKPKANRFVSVREITERINQKEKAPALAHARG